MFCENLTYASATSPVTLGVGIAVVVVLILRSLAQPSRHFRPFAGQQLKIFEPSPFGNQWQGKYTNSRILVLVCQGHDW